MVKNRKHKAEQIEAIVFESKGPFCQEKKYLFGNNYHNPVAMNFLLTKQTWKCLYEESIPN